MDNRKYISKVVSGSDTLYIKDIEAREALSEILSYTNYLGVTTTLITDGSGITTIVVDGENISAEKGNIVNYGSKEFIFNGSVWQEFGDLSVLRDSSNSNVTICGRLCYTPK